MTLKEFGIQIIRKTIIVIFSIALALCLSSYYFSTLPEGM